MHRPAYELLDSSGRDLPEGFEVLSEYRFVREVSDMPLTRSNACAVDVDLDLDGGTIMRRLLDRSLNATNTGGGGSGAPLPG